MRQEYEWGFDSTVIAATYSYRGIMSHVYSYARAGGDPFMENKTLYYYTNPGAPTGAKVRATEVANKSWKMAYVEVWDPKASTTSATDGLLISRTYFMTDGLTRDYTIAYNVDGSEATKSRYIYQYAAGATPSDRNMAGVAIYSIQGDDEILVSMQVTNICVAQPSATNATTLETRVMNLIMYDPTFVSLKNSLGRIPGGETVTLLSLQIAYATASGADLAAGNIAPYIASKQYYYYRAGTTLLERTDTYSLERGTYRLSESSRYYSETADIARYGKSTIDCTWSYGWDTTRGTAFVYQKYTKYFYHTNSVYSGSYKLYKEETVNTENGKFYFAEEVFYNTYSEYVSSCNAGGSNCYKASEYGHVVVSRKSYTDMLDTELRPWMKATGMLLLLMVSHSITAYPRIQRCMFMTP